MSYGYSICSNAEDCGTAECGQNCYYGSELCLQATGTQSGLTSLLNISAEAVSLALLKREGLEDGDGSPVLYCYIGHLPNGLGGLFCCCLDRPLVTKDAQREGRYDDGREQCKSQVRADHRNNNAHNSQQTDKRIHQSICHEFLNIGNIARHPLDKITLLLFAVPIQ